MKKTIRLKVALLSCATLLVTSLAAQQMAPESTPKIEKRIDKLMSKMSLEQKIGQMTQLALDVLTPDGPYVTNFPMEFDEAMMDSVFAKYYVGSILNAPTVTAQEVDRWNEIIKTIQEKALANGGIPVVYGLDHNHGTTYTVGGTLFPQEIAMGATFNPELVRRGAEITAYESRAGSNPWIFSPVIDLGRDPRWPRIWETYGEDSYLVSQMGIAHTLGYQGEDSNKLGDASVSACLKHFMGYGASPSGKDRTPSNINEQDMRERYFAPFKEAVRAGAHSVMVNSGMNNGLPFHINTELMTEWLKEDLQWDGVIVTDWADINNVVYRDKVAESKKEAIKLAINAGIDMTMDPYSWDFCVLLKELVEEGEVSMERIDDATRRVLRMKIRMGLFEKPYNDEKDYPLFGSDEFAAEALKSVHESITLLKNEQSILPITAKNAKFLITGPNASSMRPLNGGWTLSWQGEKADRLGSQYNTILESFTAEYGEENIVYEPGVTYNFEGKYWEEMTPEIDKAVAAAEGVDYIILCIGENSYCETPGNLDRLALSKNQRDLTKALATTGKPIIMVLSEGRPRVIEDIEPLAAAIVHTYLPGNYGGDGLVDILNGEVNPSGKLPYTYPRYENSLITYDYKPCQQLDQMAGAYNYDAVVSVQWAFGYGLSYTTFNYSNLVCSQSEFTADDTISFTIDVTNSGSVDGKESVMLFSSDLFASLTPDVRRLRSFEKIELKAGETKSVTLEVPASSLAFVGYDGKWILEKGDFMIQVGDETLNVTCTETKKWETPNI